MKRGKAPTARQKRWHDAVAQLPCVSCGATPVHVHHCVGSTTKHNKVWIGQDWVIPLCYDCHQGPGGVHGDMSRVRRMIGHDDISRKAFEKLMFDEAVIAVTDWCGITLDSAILPPADTHNAIMDYHK